MVEYLVVGLGLVALLLPGVVLIGSQRIKRRAACIIAWHEQQHTGAWGGMVMSVEVNPQPAQEHLHFLPTGSPRPPHVQCGGRRT